MKLINTLKAERGASSVLVIFMMLVLVTFGALAITSANVNYKLSRRTLDWNAMYYDMDGQGEQFISALDGKLAEAEKIAAAYIEGGEYLSPESLNVAPETQIAIFTAYNENILTAEEIYDKIYMYYADTFVKELLLDFSDAEVYPYINGSFIDSIYTEVSFKPSLPGNELCGLRVSVSIEPLSNEAGGNGLRYIIEDWYEYQEPLNNEESGEEQPEELWDGEMLQDGGELWDGSL